MLFFMVNWSKIFKLKSPLALSPSWLKNCPPLQIRHCSLPVLLSFDADWFFDASKSKKGLCSRHFYRVLNFHVHLWLLFMIINYFVFKLSTQVKILKVYTRIRKIPFYNSSKLSMHLRQYLFSYWSQQYIKKKTLQLPSVLIKIFWNKLDFRHAISKYVLIIGFFISLC